MTTTDERGEWGQRPILLAAIGAGAALIVHILIDRIPSVEADHWRLSLAVFVGIFAGLIGFTLERVRPLWTLGFAVVAATVIALITWSSGPMRGWDAGVGWRLVCAILSVAIAAPLFQTARDAGRPSFAYDEVYGHAWTNVVLFAAAWAFAAIAFALGWLIASLFQLIGVRILYDLMRHGWFDALLIGAALGGAIGLLRERDRIVRTLLTVVLVVLRVLAPILAVFLAAFLLFLPFTGLAKLWEATRSTTPIALGCMIVALILANAVVGQDDREAAQSPMMRLAARVLAVTLLPLALIGAVSLGSRIAQHGLSVDRLWALTFVAVAVAYGLGYLVAALRPQWIERLRATNLRLAFGLCAVALLLALPVIGFNRIATNAQVARLTTGRVSPDKFDWAALRFDFGAPGKAAVARLLQSRSPAIAAAATRAMTATDRYDLKEEIRVRDRGKQLALRLRTVPADAVLTPELRDMVVRSGVCEATSRCVLLLQDASHAVLVSQSCATCTAQAQPYVSSVEKQWKGISGSERSTNARRTLEALENGQVEVRAVARRQVFVGGQPVGTPFD